MIESQTLILVFKIWCTCLVLTVPCLVLNDFPKRPNGFFDAFATILLGIMVTLDLVLIFVQVLMAIWSI